MERTPGGHPVFALAPRAAGGANPSVWNCLFCTLVLALAVGRCHSWEAEFREVSKQSPPGVGIQISHESTSHVRTASASNPGMGWMPDQCPSSDQSMNAAGWWSLQESMVEEGRAWVSERGLEGSWGHRGAGCPSGPLLTSRVCLAQSVHS